MPTWRRIKVSLVERTGSESAALDLACEILAYMTEATSMGMLRAGKKTRTPEPRVAEID